jgi:hypothetical protein
MTKMSAKQGESTDLFSITVKDLVDYTDYYGDLYIIDADTDMQVLGPIRINAVDSKFSVALSPDQTTSLPVNSYTAVFQVTKEVLSVIEFRKEISCAVKITKSLLSA